MATWQQGINSGSFLAGIGQNNMNAPQANDANAAIALIRQNNEDKRSGRDNLGLQALQGLGGIAQIYQASQQQQRQQEFQNAYGNAFASGDRNAMRNLAAQYPDQVEAVRNGMKFVDDDQRSTVGNLAAGARLAATSPESMEAWLKNNTADLQRVGLDPSSVAQTYQQNPQGFGEFADHLGMAALGPDKYFDVQDKIVGQALDRDKLKEDARQADMQNATTRQGQQLSYGAQMARLNHDKYVYRQSQAALKKYGDVQDMDTLALNSKIASTGVDPLTGKPATGARIKAANNWLQGNGRFNESLISGERGIEKVNDFLDKKSFEGIGRYAGRMPDATTSAEGLANRNAIEELKSGAFVQNVQTMRGLGQLSNAEGQKLQNLISVLDITQPEDVVKKQLEEIKNQYSVLQQVAMREAESMGYSSSGYDTYVSQRKSQKDQLQEGGQQATATQGGIAEGATATNEKTGQKIVFRGGQWQPM